MKDYNIAVLISVSISIIIGVALVPAIMPAIDAQKEDSAASYVIEYLPFAFVAVLVIGAISFILFNVNSHRVSNHAMSEKRARKVSKVEMCGDCLNYVDSDGNGWCSYHGKDIKSTSRRCKKEFVNKLS